MKARLRMFKTTLQSSANYLLKGKRRFILLPLIFVALKIIGVFWLSQRLDARDFVALFHGWDSLFYVNIASSWYPNTASNVWAFFPLYPFCARVLNLLLHDVRLSTALISFLAGVLWLPVFQSIAERYMNVEEAFVSTVIFASMPYVFLFTTVAYSESIFLFTILLTWLLYLRGRFFGSCVFASLATLCRPYGILIALPIFLGLFKRKLWKKISLTFLPIATLLGWILYSFVKTGDYLVFMTAQGYWIGLGQPVNWFEQFLLPQFGIMPASQVIIPYATYIFMLPFIAITAYLIIMSFDIDWLLGIYGLAVLMSILYAGTPLSMGRFLPFIFPIWLNMRTRNLLAVFAICAFFYLHSLAIWHLFSRIIWVG